MPEIWLRISWVAVLPGDVTGNENELDIDAPRVKTAPYKYLECVNKTLAIKTMSSSDPAPLKAFKANKINRQFSGVYPFTGSIRSILGEYSRGPFLPIPRTKGRPVNAHRPL